MHHRRRLVLVSAALTAALAAGFASVSASSGAPGAAIVSAADEYAVDAVHSAVVFRILHDNAGTFFGRFNSISGSFHVDAAKPEASTLQFTIKTDTVDTANADRDKHLRSPDFFNTKQFPEATFKSTGVRKGAEGQLVAQGDLTLMGVTKSVAVTISNVKAGVSARTKKSIAGFEATFTIKRSDFGITKYLESLSDEVTVMVGIEGGRG